MALGFMGSTILCERRKRHGWHGGGIMSTLPNPATEIERSFFPSWEDMDDIRGGKDKIDRNDLREIRRRHSGPGRPPGSKNQAQQKFAAYFIGKFGDPHDVMGEIMSMDLDVLIEHMEAAQGGDAKHKPVRAIDALRLKLDAADRIAPYVRGKQPISIEVSGRKDAVIIIGGINAPAGVDPQVLSDAITEHGLEALDPDTRELRLLPSSRRIDPIPDDGDDDA